MMHNALAATLNVPGEEVNDEAWATATPPPCACGLGLRDPTAIASCARAAMAYLSERAVEMGADEAHLRVELDKLSLCTCQRWIS